MNLCTLKLYVAVNFLSQVFFVCLLFLGMVMYANELVETKEKEKLPEIKKLTTAYILWSYTVLSFSFLPSNKFLSHELEISFRMLKDHFSH